MRKQKLSRISRGGPYKIDMAAWSDRLRRGEVTREQFEEAMAQVAIPFTSGWVPRYVRWFASVKGLPDPDRDLDDIIGECLLRVPDCLKKFDADRGISFSTYYGKAIKRVIWLYFRDGHVGSLSEYPRNYRPWCTDISEDTLLDEDHPRVSELEEHVMELVSKLHWRQRKVLELRFGLGNQGGVYTLLEVGRIFRVGRERIRQIEQRAICQLQRKEKIRRWTDPDFYQG